MIHYCGHLILTMCENLKWHQIISAIGFELFQYLCKYRDEKTLIWNGWGQTDRWFDGQVDRHKDSTSSGLHKGMFLWMCKILQFRSTNN